MVKNTFLSTSVQLTFPTLLNTYVNIQIILSCIYLHKAVITHSFLHLYKYLYSSHPALWWLALPKSLQIHIFISFFQHLIHVEDFSIFIWSRDFMFISVPYWKVENLKIYTRNLMIFHLKKKAKIFAIYGFYFSYAI